MVERTPSGVVSGVILGAGDLLRPKSGKIEETEEIVRQRLDDTRLQQLRDAIIPDILDEINNAFERGKLIIQGTVLTNLNDLVGLVTGFTTKDKLVLVQDALEAQQELAQGVEKLLAEARAADDTAKIAEFEATLGEFKESIEGIIAERDELQRLLTQERARGEGRQAPFGPGPFETRRCTPGSGTPRRSPTGELLRQIDCPEIDTGPIAELLGELRHENERFLKAAQAIGAGGAAIDEGAKSIARSAISLEGAAGAMEEALAEIGARPHRGGGEAPGGVVNRGPGRPPLPGGLTSGFGSGGGKISGGGLGAAGFVAGEDELRRAAKASGLLGQVLVEDREELEELGVIGERVFGDLTGVLERFLEGGKLGWRDFARIAINALEDILQQQLRVLSVGGSGGGFGITDSILGFIGLGSGGSTTGGGGAPSAPGGGFIPGLGFGLAGGGPVSPGRAFLIGEEGPELFLPKTAGTVVPNPDTMRLLSADLAPAREPAAPAQPPPNFKVTVINNTGQQAQTRQRRTPGGGREIDVIVGELAAKDVLRGGPLHRAIRLAFAVDPMTVTR